MKKEQHLPDINTENEVFKSLSCNLSVLTLVIYNQETFLFFVPRCSPTRDLGFHSKRMMRKLEMISELQQFISEYRGNSNTLKHSQINRGIMYMKYMAWLLLYPLFINKPQFSGGLSRENTEILPGQYLIETFLATYPETQQEANLCSPYEKPQKRGFDDTCISLFLESEGKKEERRELFISFFIILNKLLP